jgi:hypothetical protein
MARHAITDEKDTARARYKELAKDREPYILRGDRCARLTLPMYQSVYERLGRNAKNKITQPWQTLGGQGVNNLAAKLLLTMLPPSAPIFRHKIKGNVIEQQAHGAPADQIGQLKTALDKALGKMERWTTDKIEACGDRTPVFEALKRVGITGNALLKVGEEQSRVFGLPKYVIVRDPEGEVLEIIVEETKDRSTLDADVQAAYDAEERREGEDPKKEKEPVKVYTWVKRVGNLFTEHVEVCGRAVEGTEGSYPVDASPWIPMRFYYIDGEDYGRSYVEEVLGDLISLENLYKSVVETSAAVARVLFFVNPNGITKQSEVAKAANGAVLTGSAADITTLTADKRADLQVTLQIIERLEARLSKAFLMNTSIQRKGERVTAEEIRYMATELDDALGGVYTAQSREFQLPFIKARQHLMTMARELPHLPQGVVYPAILTGYDALGRSLDRQKLVNYLTTISGALGPEAVGKYVIVTEALKRLATADGIDPEGLIKTEDQIAAEQQQEQQLMMAQQLGPQAIQQIGNAMTKGNQ